MSQLRRQLENIVEKYSQFIFFVFVFFYSGYLIAQSEPSPLQDGINSFFGAINTYWGGVIFWSDHPLRLPLVLVLMVAGGLFFTFRYGFVNVTLFKHGIDVVRGKFDKKHDKGEISHFQALTAALSATVGLGNIAGVAVAISLGGPGAVFWLWVVAFFGMSMKFSSCTFSQLYRVVHMDGTVLGGPMVYLEQGFKEKLPKYAWVGRIFSVIFAGFIIVSSFGGGNLFQGNQTYELLANQFPSLVGGQWIVGLLLSFFIGIVIIGGIRRIGEVTGKLVPFMCVFYCLSCLAIILGNLTEIPSLLSSIFVQAFSPDAIWAGGFIGILTQGVQRGAFSNEAGLGSASIAHAAAKTDQPVREGIVAMLGPFIDTHIVCTMTALSILITGAHLDPTLAGKGAAITAKAFGSLGTIMPFLLTIAAIIFAYSTAISWSYYGEKGVEFLFGKKAIKHYRLIYVLVAALGPVLSLSNVIDFSDIMLLSLAFPNIIGMALLSSIVKKKLAEYKDSYMKGLFNPESPEREDSNKTDTSNNQLAS